MCNSQAAEQYKVCISADQCIQLDAAKTLTAAKLGECHTNKRYGLVFWAQTLAFTKQKVQHQFPHGNSQKQQNII